MPEGTLAVSDFFERQRGDVPQQGHSCLHDAVSAGVVIVGQRQQLLANLVAVL